MTVPQCIHYALSRPAVVSTLIGCQNTRQVEEAAGYLNTRDDERYIISHYKGELSGKCVYCNHCQPCPAGIEIAVVNKYLDIASLNITNIPPSIKQHYRSLPANGAHCITCGNCEGKCPFNVPVINNMERAALVFNIN